MNPRPRERVRGAHVSRAEPESLRENQVRGGGIGGFSIRGEAVLLAVENAWPVKPGVKQPPDVGQKRISVEHETVQQLRGCDSWSPHRFCWDVCSCIILHPDILEQQSDGFGIAITFDLPTEGQRKVARHTINNAFTAALRITSQFNSGLIQIKESLSTSKCVDCRAKMENRLRI